MPVPNRPGLEHRARNNPAEAAGGPADAEHPLPAARSGSRTPLSPAPLLRTAKDNRGSAPGAHLGRLSALRRALQTSDWHRPRRIRCHEPVLGGGGPVLGADPSCQLQFGLIEEGINLLLDRSQAAAGSLRIACFVRRQVVHDPVADLDSPRVMPPVRR